MQRHLLNSELNKEASDGLFQYLRATELLKNNCPEASLFNPES